MATNKRPTAEELRKAQTNVKQVLEDVINHGDTITIHNAGKPAAVLLPFDRYVELRGLLEAKGDTPS